MPSSPNPLPDYDWELAREKLVFYFSRRGLMNAEDLAQETLTRLVKWLREGNQIAGKDGFMKTVFGFARNVRLEGVKEGARTAEELPEDLPSPTNTTWGLNAQELKRLLQQVLNALPERDRDLILAAEEVSPDQLAEQMSTRIETLRVWIHRAREKARQMWADQIDGPQKESKELIVASKSTRRVVASSKKD